MTTHASFPTEHPFETDTQVVPTGDGYFDGALSDRWNALGGVVNGGYAGAVCLRALGHTLPHHDPLVVSTFYQRAGAPGAVRIHTDNGRQGRRTSTGSARMYQNGKEIVRTTATFADLAQSDGPTTILASAPSLPAPEDAVDPIGDTPPPGVTMTDHIEFRYPELPPWRHGESDGTADAAFWIGFKQPYELDTLSLPMLVDGAAPVILGLGVAGSATLELTTHVRNRPAPGWLACRVVTRYLVNGYHEEDFEMWDSAGNLVAQARQLALARAS